MMNRHSINCNNCGFGLPCPTWGFFYVTDDNGNRLALAGELESTTIANTIGISEDAIVGCVFSPERNGEAIQLMQERVGYNSFFLCLTCLERCALDQKRDILQCPSCGSSDVRTFIQLIDTACPRCRKGTIRETVP